MGTVSHDQSGSLNRAVRAVFSVTLLSRLGGLARDVIVGRLFGDTALGSAFAAAFAIPNTFRRLFGEGALSAAFIPVYADVSKGRDPAPAHRLASLVLALLATVTLGLTALIELVLLILLLTLPHDPERVLSLKLIMVMLPFMPLICVVAVLAGMLQVHEKFAASSTGPLVLNAFIIVVGLFFIFTGEPGTPAAAYVIGVATVISGLTQAIWFRGLLREHFTFRSDLAPARADGARVLSRFFPVLLGLGTLQLSALIDTAIAMWPIWVGPTILGHDYPLDERANVILSLVQRLYQFPLGVFGIAVATAVFPLLSRCADQPEQFIDTLRRGLRLSFFIGLPATVGLVIVRHDLVHVFYGGGGARGWSPEGVSRGAAVLTGYAAAVWAYALNHVLTRAFYALGNTTTPTKVAVGMVVANTALSLTLIWWLREAGMSWATAATATVQCAVLAALLSRRLGRLLDRPTLTAFARVVMVTLFMAGACLLVHWVLTVRVNLGAAVRLGAVTAVGLAGFGVVAVFAGCRELRWLAGR